MKSQANTSLVAPPPPLSLGSVLSALFWSNGIIFVTLGRVFWPFNQLPKHLAPTTSGSGSLMP